MTTRQAVRAPRPADMQPVAHESHAFPTSARHGLRPWELVVGVSPDRQARKPHTHGT
jgi:hypothetical protein